MHLLLYKVNKFRNKSYKKYNYKMIRVVSIKLDILTFAKV